FDKGGPQDAEVVRVPPSVYPDGVAVGGNQVFERQLDELPIVEDDREDQGVAVVSHVGNMRDHEIRRHLVAGHHHDQASMAVTIDMGIVPPLVRSGEGLVALGRPAKLSSQQGLELRSIAFRGHRYASGIWNRSCVSSCGTGGGGMSSRFSKASRASRERRGSDIPSSSTSRRRLRSWNVPGTSCISLNCTGRRRLSSALTIAYFTVGWHRIPKTTSSSSSGDGCEPRVPISRHSRS